MKIQYTEREKILRKRKNKLKANHLCKKKQNKKFKMTTILNLTKKTSMVRAKT